MNKTWTDDKSRLKVETLKAILTVKVNFKMTCLKFYDFIKGQHDMLRQIASKEKYNVRIENGIEQIEDDSDVEADEGNDSE